MASNPSTPPGGSSGIGSLFMMDSTLACGDNLDMQLTPDERRNLITKLQEELATLKNLSEKKDEHIDQLAKRIKEVSDSSVQFEIQFQSELEEMKSLANHHRESYEKEKKTNQQLLDAVEEMQKLLLDGQQAQQDLEETLTRATMDLQKVIKHKDEVIKKLNDEITLLKAEAVTKAQEEMEKEVSQYFPTASATHKVFKSDMSLSQLYNAYVVLQEKLDASQVENNLLKEQLTQLVEEAEQKTPFIHQKVQESRKSLQKIKDLQIQLTKVTSEKDSLIEERENLIQINHYLNREISRLEQTSQDLALQVRSLIKTTHEAKGYELVSQDKVPDRETEESAANRIITQHLVTFADITELQTNNQRLIFSIRDLASENERLVKQLADKEQVSKDEMSKAFEEISKLTEERRQQSEMLSELMEAKNTLKSIVGSDESNRRPSPTSKDSAVNTIKELRESLRRIQDENTAMKADFEQKMKELNDDITHYRRELSVMQAEKSRIESASEYIQQKMKLLQANHEYIKKDNSKLTESNIKLNTKLAKSESNLTALLKEINELKGTRDRLETNIQALQAERDLLKNAEKRLTQERDTLNMDYMEKSKLISTIQQVLENFSRLESESTKGLHLQIEKLENEANQLRMKLDEDEQNSKNIMEAHTKEIADLQSKIDFEYNRNSELQVYIATTENRLQLLENEFEMAKCNFEAEKAKIEVQENPEQAKRIRELEQELTKQEATIKELREENEHLQKKFTEKEKYIKEFATKAKSRVATLTAQKNKIEQEKEALTKRVTELETKVSTTEAQTAQSKLISKRLEETEKLARTASLQAQTFKTQNDNLTRINAELKEKLDMVEDNAKRSLQRFKTLSTSSSTTTPLSSSAIKLNRPKTTQQDQSEARFTATHTQSTSATVGSAAASTSGSVAVVNVPTPSSSSTSSSTGLVRHPVLPQKQESPVPKSTPRASIRPLSVSRLPPIARSTSTTLGNVAVVAVQPNTEDSSQLVPQATVAPTVVTTLAATAPAFSSEPMSSSTSTASTSTTTSSSIPLSSTAMSSSTPSPATAEASVNNNQSQISSSEATPQLERVSRQVEVIPSTRDNQNSDRIITSSQGSVTLNQEPSVTTSDESAETSRQGTKRQRESPSPSTSGPQIEEDQDDSTKKVRLEEGNTVDADQEMTYDSQHAISTQEQDDSVDESKEIEVNELSPDRQPAATSQEVQQEHEYQQEEYIQPEQLTVSADSFEVHESEENEQEMEEEEEEREESEEDNEEEDQDQEDEEEEDAEEEVAEEERNERITEEREEHEEEEEEAEDDDAEDDEDDDDDDDADEDVEEKDEEEEQDVGDDGDEDDVTIIQP